MSKVHVNKGDEVYILSGRDRGKTGKVTAVHTKSGKVTVDGVNMVKKHRKPRPPKEVEGGIKEEAAPIDASNVKLNKDAKAKSKSVKADSKKAPAKTKDSDGESKAKAEAKPSSKKTPSKKKSKE